MPILRADYIFDGKQMLPPDTALMVNAVGEIQGICPASHATQYVQGLLMPGLINAHCHLELSHLYQQIKPHGGLIDFVQQIVRLRKLYTPETIQSAIVDALQQSYNMGIVAIGDICNTTDTLAAKLQFDAIQYHSFIECFGVDPAQAEQIIARANSVREALEACGNTSLVLHAPYSMSETLAEYIFDAKPTVHSIHNQETASENEMFISGQGGLFQMIQSLLPPAHHWKPIGKSSLQSILPILEQSNQHILVHNTFTSLADIQATQKSAATFYWCLCPQANLYIENKLPDVPALYHAQCRIIIGTDSLASNDALDVYDEVLLLHEHFPTIPFTHWLRAATYEGACALQLQDQLGSFEKGKKPGIIAIEHPHDRIAKKITRLF